MIMGLNSNSQVWSDAYIEGLVNEGFHVVIFDNRDIGKSEWLTQEPGFISFIKSLSEWFIEYFVDFTLSFMFDESGRFNMANPAPAEYDLNDMAKDGIAILDHVGKQKAHIVGASLGGMISQVMTLNYPERVSPNNINVYSLDLILLVFLALPIPLNLQLKNLFC